MAEAAVTFLLESVAQLVKHRYNLIRGAKDELKLLENDLESLKAFLCDAARMPNKPEGFLKIESDIRDVVYDAEDTIDSCMVHAAAASNSKKPSFRARISRHVSSKRASLAEDVKSLRQKRVIPMVATARTFADTAMIKGLGATKEESPPTPTKIPIIREANVVGFDDKEAMIISYLLEPKKELDVISIIGMPGLGKTTLAWKVFKNENIIKREFPNRIWIYVTQTPNIKDVFLNILKEFTSKDMSHLRHDALIEAVQDFLKKRKFLLVLDDVWTPEVWEKISVVLSKSNNMSSKVLITSRDESVGVKASQPREPYKLPFLSEAQSWELLQFEVYGELDKWPDELKIVGECIADRCDGLPLSIVVIGGILLDQRAKDKEISVIKEAWKNVAKGVSSFLKRDLKKVSDIVELSYNRLHDELRNCFLYLAVFPEDYEISAWTLTRLWIAEGFIQGKDLEKTAEENLKDLISRNLVMVGQRNPSGEVKTCRVHDVIRTFCSSKASLKQQNLFQEMTFSNGAFDPPISEIDRYRRLCIHSDLDHFINQVEKAEKRKVARIRSLLCVYKAPAKLPLEYAPNMVQGFDLLRVMESKSIKLDQIPVDVHKLYLLRYITLSVDTLHTLAEGFSNLWNLQTLVVYTKSEFLQMKANIWKMVQLRHFKTKAVIKLTTLSHKEDGEGCKDLRTLGRISPEYCTKDVFSKAPHLKRLGIQGDLASVFNNKSLGMLNQLEKLKLVNTSQHSESKGSMLFPELRDWFPPKLKMLTITATYLDWEKMSTLMKIETLEVLKLKKNAFTGISWKADGRGFRDLHFLLIEEMDLFSWEASNDSFPSLRSLVLKKCVELKEIPMGVVEKLEKLDIEHLRKSAVESARKIEEEKITNHGQQRAAARFKLTIGSGCE